MAAPTAISASADSTVVTDPRRQRMILIAMCTALVAVVASVSGLNVAQQDLAIDLGASQSALLWIINGYTMALAALLLPVGAIGDRFGRKKVLATGLVVFALANVAAAFAPTATAMLIARVVAGAGAAMIMPVTLSVITSSFPEHEKAKAVGIWAGFAGAGGILGLFFSSVMIDYFSWPWLFAMPVVLSAVALGVTLVSVGESREDHEGRFDVAGSLLSALAIGALVLGIHEGPEHGWSAPLTVVGLVVGVVALAAFVAWELHHEHPLFDVRALRDRGMSSGALTLMILFAVMFGLFLVLVQFLQAVLGWSALHASVGLLPMAVLMMPLSAVAPTVAERIGTRTTLLVGTGVFGVGLATLATMASAEGGYWSILPGLMILSVGMGLAMTPSTTAITGGLPAEKQGVASALNDTVRELGGALGVALLGSVLNSGYQSHVAAATENLPAALREPVESGIGQALAVSSQLGDQAGPVVHAARDAFVSGWTASMWVGVAMAGVAFLYVLVRGPRNEVEAGVQDDVLALPTPTEVVREPALVD